MKQNNAIKQLSLILLFLSAYSCSRYIDVAKDAQNVPIKQGFLNYYTDSNVLVYKSNVSLKRDAEIIYPKHFIIKLPKKIRFYEIINSTDFVFYYDKNQVVLLNIDLNGKEANVDTSYSPNISQINDFIQDKMFTATRSFDVKKIPAGSNRKQMILIKGAATILLYNIQPKNIDLFYQDVSRIDFIK